MTNSVVALHRLAVNGVVASQRRKFALMMFGALGIFGGCYDRGTGDTITPLGPVDEVGEQVVGTSALKWVDTIADLKTVTGQGVSAGTTATVTVLGRTSRGD